MSSIVTYMYFLSGSLSSGSDSVSVSVLENTWYSGEDINDKQPFQSLQQPFLHHSWSSSSIVSTFGILWSLFSKKTILYKYKPAFSRLSREMQANAISHRVYICLYIYIFIYMYGTRSFFATACKGWVLVTPRKAITKIQKAAGQKPHRKWWEKGWNTQKLWWMKHELTRTSPTKVRVFR